MSASLLPTLLAANRTGPARDGTKLACLLACRGRVSAKPADLHKLQIRPCSTGCLDLFAPTFFLIKLNVVIVISGTPCKDVYSTSAVTVDFTKGQQAFYSRQLDRRSAARHTQMRAAQECSFVSSTGLANNFVRCCLQPCSDHRHCSCSNVQRHVEHCEQGVHQGKKETMTCDICFSPETCVRTQSGICKILDNFSSS